VHRPLQHLQSHRIERVVDGRREVAVAIVDEEAIAVTIIGAQSLCLFLTLLLVPAAYVKLDALEQSLANKRLSAWLSRVRVLGPGRRATTEG
jgi:hypothetical protein